MYTPTSLAAQTFPLKTAFQPAQLRDSLSFLAENFANEVLSLTSFGVIEQPLEE
jgi:hypothetical protein